MHSFSLLPLETQLRWESLCIYTEQGSAHYLLRRLCILYNCASCTESVRQSAAAIVNTCLSLLPENTRLGF